MKHVKQDESSSKKLDNFTLLQSCLFGIVNNYQDLVYPYQSPANTQQLRNIYCLHILNHLLENQKRILKNNEKLKDDPDLELRDQGYTRPTILILCPFRENAYQIVHT